METSWLAVQIGPDDSTIFHLSASGECKAQYQRKFPAQELDAVKLCEILADLSILSVPIDVVVCGALPKFGPLRKIPCKAFGQEALAAIPSPNPNFRLHYAAGLMQDKPFDILSREVIEIAGLLAVYPKFDGVCLTISPIRSAWNHISAEEIVSLRSFASLGLWQKLTKSLLYFNYSSDDFSTGVSTILSRPERLASKISSLEAQIFAGEIPQEAADLQSLGLLIGAELAASKIYWLGQDITLIGEEAYAKPYQAALALQGSTAKILPPQTCAMAGFKQLHNSLK